MKKIIVLLFVLIGCYNDPSSLQKQVTLLEVRYVLDHSGCIERSLRCDGNKISQYCHAGEWHNLGLCIAPGDYCVPEFGECNSILTAE